MSTALFCRTKIVAGHRIPVWIEALFATIADDRRVRVRNQNNNLMFDGTEWLYDECWKRGYFGDI